MGEQALRGLRILDLSQRIAGPYCTRLLAGLGAEVIKIEEPNTGDPARAEGPFPNDQPHPEKSGLFLYLNANKRSVTLNLKCPSGARIFKELAKQADVVVESFEPSRLASLGLDYAALRGMNPSLVMTSISNFGQSGPYRDFGATEIVEYAMSGLMALTGEPDREPLKVGGNIAQYTAGQTAFIAILGALFYREATGLGQQVDVSIMETCCALLEFQMPQLTYRGHIAQRLGNASEKGHPHGVYPCRDGYVTFLPYPHDKFPILAELMGVPALRDPKFADSFGRIQHRDEIDALMLPWLVEHTRKEIYEHFQGHGVPCGYVRSAEEVVDCRQLAARDFFAEVEHPAAGTFIYPGAPYKLQETPWQVGRAPLLGEHNDEVYEGILGYSNDDLGRLRQTKVI